MQRQTVIYTVTEIVHVVLVLAGLITIANSTRSCSRACHGCDVLDVGVASVSGMIRALAVLGLVVCTWHVYTVYKISKSGPRPVFVSLILSILINVFILFTILVLRMIVPSCMQSTLISGGFISIYVMLVVILSVFTGVVSEQTPPVPAPEDQVELVERD